MNTKNLFSILIIFISGILLYYFVLPFKAEGVDTVTLELEKLQAAYERANQQVALKSLRLKKSRLNTQDLAILENFVPQDLRSGYLVYNLSQLANQNGLTLKGLQYSVIDNKNQVNLNDKENSEKNEKKLLIEFTMEGKYDNFANWMQAIERSNVLIDVESIRGAKNTNFGETITFTVKMYTYGVNID